MAALLGVVSSTYSTLISQLAAERIGRDAAVDWMSVAAIPARDWAISSEPSNTAITIGIAFHQWADFSWALFFFGVLGRWTSAFKPAHLALLALPWAVATSSLEWFVLVPLVPFWQPIFTLQQPLWIGLFVHLSSAVVYPLFPWMFTGTRLAARDRNFTGLWAMALTGVLAVLGGSALLARHDIEVGWIGGDPTADQTFIRHMSTHHQQGVELATMAVERAANLHLRSLARLMIASQNGEIRITDQWWRRWFGPGISLCTSSEAASMPGYLTEAQLDRVRSAPGDAFDARFIEAMTIHHRGAAIMADHELSEGSDIRLRAFAHSIRHAQQGEIALMNGAAGLSAVRSAISHMIEKPSFEDHQQLRFAPSPTD
jgi:uncharacterized protein (DUF305 family)